MSGGWNDDDDDDDDVVVVVVAAASAAVQFFLQPLVTLVWLTDLGPYHGSIVGAEGRFPCFDHICLTSALDPWRSVLTHLFLPQ